MSPTGCSSTFATTALTKSRDVSGLHVVGGARPLCVLSSTAAYSASISGSYSRMMAWRRGVFFAVYVKGFAGVDTVII